MTKKIITIDIMLALIFIMLVMMGLVEHLRNWWNISGIIALQIWLCIFIFSLYFLIKLKDLIE